MTKCKFAGCSSHACFNVKGEMARFCSKHKAEDMVDVKNKRCEHDGCNHQPVFDVEGGKGRYCFTHKVAHMIDVKSKRCQHEECRSHACFNVQGCGARFCGKHKGIGMIDVLHTRCEHANCTILNPSFNFEGECGRFCSKHKSIGMVNVTSKKCAHKECNSLNPKFDIKGGKGLFCCKHKEDGMVDVKSRLCAHDGCNFQPTYNFIGEQALFCNRHKSALMIDVKHKWCNHHGCMTRPIFNYEGLKAHYCSEHKATGMVDLKSKRCLLCPTLASKKQYKGYCYRCFIHTYPDNTIVRNHKTKERTVADFIKEQFSCYDISFDKRIEGGCSARRPDVLIDLGHRVIVIEIDENQHGTYDCSCENKRLMQLFLDVGMRPMTFVRFNPDQYNDHNQKSVSSCWGLTKDRGICIVKPNKQKEWNQRLNVLKEHVRHVCEHGGEKEIDVIHLFYDGWSL